MAAEYEVNIKLNTGNAETQLKNIESSVAKIGKTEKQSINTTDRRVASLVKLRSIGDDIAALEKKGVDMSKARAQLNKADVAINKKNFLTANARLGVAVKHLNTQRSITKELERQEKARRRQRMKRAEGVALGAGFPLLFGGGAGSVIGGGLGGLTGSFGAQIALSALGQQVDKFVAGMVDAGKALTSVGGAADFMAEKSLFSSDSMQFRIEKLIEEGQVTEAAALMTQEMAKQVGGSGLKALKDLGTEASKMGKIFSTLLIRVQAFLAKALTPLLKLINSAVGGLTAQSQLDQMIAEAGSPERGAEILARSRELRGVKRSARTGKAMGLNALTPKVIEKLQEEYPAFIPEGAAIEPTQLELLKAADSGGGKATREANRLQKRLSQLETERQKVLDISVLKDKIAAAEAAGNKQLVVRLNGQQKIRDIEAQRLKDLAGVTKESEIQAINDLAAAKTVAAQRDIARELNALERQRQEQFQNTVENLEYQLLLSQATSEAERERLRIERELQELRDVDMSEPQIAQIDDLMGQISAENAPLARFIRESTEALNDLETRAVEISQGIGEAIGNSLVNGLDSLISGAQNVQEVFADMLRSIANILAQQAVKMIATYIAIGVARMFAGMPKMSGGESIDISGVNASTVESLGGLGADGLPSIGFRANGGSVSAGSPYIVGERGPELFVPGAKGNIVPNNAMGGANVTVNVDASGSSVQGDGPSAQQLGKAIGAAVQAELIKQKRPGGLLTR